MVGPGALKPKVGDGIKSRRPLSAPVLHSFILLCCEMHECSMIEATEDFLQTAGSVGYPLSTYRYSWTQYF